MHGATARRSRRGDSPQAIPKLNRSGPLYQGPLETGCAMHVSAGAWSRTALYRFRQVILADQADPSALATTVMAGSRLAGGTRAREAGDRAGHDGAGGGEECRPALSVSTLRHLAADRVACPPPPRCQRFREAVQIQVDHRSGVQRQHL